MAHRRSYGSSCDILEIEEEELNSLEHHRGIHHPKSDLRTDGRDRRSLASNVGRISSLEDDLNQLFEIFNRRNSSQGIVHSPRNGVGPSKKNSSKKPIRLSNSPSFDSGAPERASLKQAFRGLCISQASQVASVKRSAKSGGSSKVGQVMTLYKNVAVEDGSSTSIVSQYKGKQDLLEISFMPEESAPSSSGVNLEALSTDSIAKIGQDTFTQTELEGPSSFVENSQDEMLYSSPIPDDSLLRTSKSSPIDTPMFSASSNCASRESSTEISQKDEHAPLPSKSCSNDGKTDMETVKPVATSIETISASPASGFQTSKIEMFHKQDHADAISSHWADGIGITREPTKICPSPYKPVNKGSAANRMRKNDLQTVPSVGLANGSHVKKQTKSVSRLVKPVIKTKNFVKRKSKKDAASVNSPKDTRSEFNNVLYPGSNHIVCPRCHCVLNEEWEEVDEELPLSPGASPSTELSHLSPIMSPITELSPDNVFSDISTSTFNINSANKSKEAVKARGNSKSKDAGEFTQSSKSSPDEYSSSTSMSQENNVGRSSCWDRPHMSKNARWQAIRQIRMQHGGVSLKNFNLLKKLGCGDIGTVYLAELIDTSSLFAIKVMDNEFLARRKKMMRAQTEREILRMLDHPFLPTLFCQFTSDNLSCLVMEYCPGGDLHVLRQMQPGRCFSEQATRFYVAEVLLALEYLHMLGVVYRDLKPENILVRDDGHIMLSDFDLSLRCAVSPTLLVSPSTTDTSISTSKPYKNSKNCVEPLCIRQPSCQVSCFGPKILRRPKKHNKPKPEPSDLLKPLLQLVAEPTDARSNSFVGTHEYLAPEIIKGEGHGSAVDWWTLGIFIYELLYGKTPFRGSGNEETLANVVLQSLKFPDSPVVSLQARDLIVGLLVKDPEGRLGSERGAAEIKQHPFFEGLNWALIRCAAPPELPEFHRSNGVGKGAVFEKGNNNGNNSNKYLEYNASTGEHLEFEVF